MALSTRIKELSNAALSPLNVRVDSRTQDRLEEVRLGRLAESGHFDRPVFPAPPCFLACDADAMFQKLRRYEACFDVLADPAKNSVAYRFENDWFTSPDAEILYTLIREHRPRTVLEVGCGNSTRITRQAILDGELDCRIIAVDPQPRRDVAEIVDEFIQSPVENLSAATILSQLKSGDVLFIDSSHQVRTANDVVFLFLQVLPHLPAGVLIHVHDIFLPYDYPREWVVSDPREYAEQYIVQALLTFSSAFEVIWPGHYLQRTRSDFADHFPRMKGRSAQSLWLQKK